MKLDRLKFCLWKMMDTVFFASALKKNNDGQKPLRNRIPKKNRLDKKI